MLPARSWAPAEHNSIYHRHLALDQVLYSILEDYLGCSWRNSDKIHKVYTSYIIMQGYCLTHLLQTNSKLSVCYLVIMHF